MEDERPVYEPDGYFDEEAAIAELIQNNILCAVNLRYENFRGEIAGTTVGLVVNAGDVFMWACGDSENVATDEIEDLYKAWKENKLGVMKWCCLHRKQRPQDAVEIAMKEAGIWDAQMEALK